ncbi:MAG: metal-dependent transcriptional regulator [Lachnospiraceae bacterium]|nr:metal-dependent transcriptional regulator [Lachnospiraceae bacterium]
MKMTSSLEDYLKTILILQKKNRPVRSVDIARSMNVSKPSVSYAMKKLVSDGMIVFDDDGMVSLTESGRTAAENVYNKHELIGKVLMRIGVSKQTALKDACLIEHVISDETYKRLLEFHSDYTVNSRDGMGI